MIFSGCSDISSVTVRGCDEGFAETTTRTLTVPSVDARRNPFRIAGPLPSFWWVTQSLVFSISATAPVKAESLVRTQTSCVPPEASYNSSVAIPPNQPVFYE